MALERLLGDLARQRLSPELFEVIVVDDGSQPRVAARIKQTLTPYSLRLLEQANAGPAAARHRGVLVATGEILVFLDDDMQVGPDFLNQHLAEHAALGRVVVLGLIQAPPLARGMPVFERFHLDSLARQAQQVRAGEVQLRGLNLCTGNVSMRRLDYLAVGGFDVSLRESEDRDLGIRLEQAGIRICMSDTAASTHATDHGDVAVWLNRSRRYGVNDLKIHRKYAQVPDTNPWRFLFMVSPLSMPLLLTAASTTASTRGVTRAVMKAAGLVDRVGISSVALKLATLAYGVEYFSGLREESGTLPDAMRGLAEELSSMGAARRAEAVTATATFLAAMEGDKAGSLRHRA